ncbi:MAG: gliding motility-associated ABC transporter substrate-binding protein GldG [Bacteroidetes bacterium]|nr:gliding motility-associated ABC transporter substrate-binding protein GldG [Bacteroidota bacterium]
MQWIKKIYASRYLWVIMLFLFLAICWGTSSLRFTLDLTAEKRFSLGEPTKNLLKNIDSPIYIQVFLAGDLPADYKKLAMSTQDLLNEFRDISHNEVIVNFEIPGKDLPDSSKAILYDSLQRMGVVFETNEDFSDNTGKATRQLIIPSAIVTYKNLRPYVIDLRSSKTIFKNYNVINDLPQEDKEATLNAAEALLEFKFSNAIEKLTRKYIPTIGYAIGNGEPVDLRINDLGESLRNDYRLGVFDLSHFYPRADQIDALLIVKPTKPFSDEDKLKIDQYIMHGGKVIWCIDKLYAELDSLMRSQADFVAYDRNLNIDDILFKYGVRINGNLLQDLNCSKIPIVVGQNPDGSPRFQRIPWPYYPFVSSTNDNLISKNLDRVLTIFPSSMDTIKAPGIQKTILLTSDTNSRVLSSPAMVSLNSVKDDEDFLTFNQSHIPIAVLLEGKFSSLFANRLSIAQEDSVQIHLGKPFANISPHTKQVVISDADLVTNAVSNTSGPLPMGMLPFENYRFANREFLLNCVDYLVSNNEIFASRNKDFTLRLLDKKKVASQKLTWQLLNIMMPISLVIIFGFIYQETKRRKFSKS